MKLVKLRLAQSYRAPLDDASDDSANRIAVGLNLGDEIFHLLRFRLIGRQETVKLPRLLILRIHQPVRRLKPGKYGSSRRRHRNIRSFFRFRLPDKEVREPFFHLTDNSGRPCLFSLRRHRRVR